MPRALPPLEVPEHLSVDREVTGHAALAMAIGALREQPPSRVLEHEDIPVPASSTDLALAALRQGTHTVLWTAQPPTGGLEEARKAGLLVRETAPGRGELTAALEAGRAALLGPGSGQPGPWRLALETVTGPDPVRLHDPLDPDGPETIAMDALVTDRLEAPFELLELGPPPRVDR